MNAVIEVVQFENHTGECAAAHNEVAVGPMFQKTKLCKFYAKGRCLRGGKCVFAHGQQDLAPLPDFMRTTLCPDFRRNGECPRGQRCKFAHGSEELRPRLSERVSWTTKTALRATKQQTEVVAAEEVATTRGPGSADELAKLEALKARLSGVAKEMPPHPEPFTAKPLRKEDQVTKVDPTSLWEESAAQWWSRPSSGAEGAPLKRSQMFDDGLDSNNDLGSDDSTCDVPCWLSQASALSVPGLVVKNTFIDVAEEEGVGSSSLRRVHSSPHLRILEDVDTAFSSS